jgi:hypothetical protein
MDVVKYVPLNWRILQNPLNWIIVLLMILIPLYGLELLAHSATPPQSPGT